MKKRIRKIVLRSLLCLFIAVAGYFSYEFILKYPLQEYFKSQVMKRMKQNFVNHEKDFEQLVELGKSIENLEEFELYENNIISLRISKYNSEETLKTEYIWLLERNDSVFDDRGDYGGEVFIKSIEFLKDSSLVLNTLNDNNKIEEFDNWEISYKGKFANPIAKEILNYQKIDFMNFTALKEKLEKVNCHSYWKTEGLISLTYAGRSPSDYFAYYIYDKPSTNTKYILGKDYSCHYQLPSACLIDITNWYGEGKVD